MLGKEIDYFSYPHGSQDQVTQSIVKNAGFKAALSSETGRFSVEQRFLLPRHMVPNINGAAFSNWLYQRI